jgi:flagellar hook-length control protein FliK
MSTPIKSSVTNRPGQGGVSGASEMVARLQAQARGAQAPSASQSFASLMSQQNVAAQAAPAPKAPAKAAERQAPSSDPAAKAQAAARAHEQTLTRARQQAQATQRAAQQAAQAAEQGAQAGKLPPQAQQAQAERAEVSRRAERPVESGKPGPAAEAERAAEAPESNREAKPVAGDPAGMMAWLAGMLPQAKPAALTGAEALAQAAQDPSADAELDLAELASTEADPAAQTALGAEADGGVALDPSQWQQTTALAGLQVDAMLGRAGESALEAKGEAGALSGLAPGANVRAGGLTPAAAPRHGSATLTTPFGHADFSQALADKVSLWVNTARTDGPMTAELHLNPADMGPIQVKIALEGQSAQVDFAAAAAETRKAIEASLSALSSALSDVGLNLTGGDVTSQTAQQSFGQQSAPSEGARGVSTGSSAASAAEDEGDAAFMQGVSAPRAGRPGGLDLYA